MVELTTASQDAFVILSAAKDLYRGNEILRFAQNDGTGIHDSPDLKEPLP